MARKEEKKLSLKDVGSAQKKRHTRINLVCPRNLIPTKEENLWKLFYFVC
jgi:hypothetical protein